MSRNALPLIGSALTLAGVLAGPKLADQYIEAKYGQTVEALLAGSDTTDMAVEMSSEEQMAFRAKISSALQGPVEATLAGNEDCQGVSIRATSNESGMNSYVSIYRWYLEHSNPTCVAAIATALSQKTAVYLTSQIEEGHALQVHCGATQHVESDTGISVIYTLCDEPVMVSDANGSRNF